jgi:voltage-gated potassium channel
MSIVVEAPARTNAAYARIVARLEWPMAILALAVIPALLLDDGVGTPRTHLIATSVNWFIWLAFCGEFAVRLAAAPDRRVFLRQSWVDLLVIVITPPFGVPETLQGLRAVRALRAVRLFRMARLIRAVAVLSIGVRMSQRVLRHHRFHYVVALTLGVTLLGAAGLYVVERNQNEGLKSFWDALWWAISTTTTVGYGEIIPQTGEGRLIAMLLMLTGVAVIGVFTATVASLFMIHDEGHEFHDVQRRLDAIEGKLDRLLGQGR